MVCVGHAVGMGDSIYYINKTGINIVLKLKSNKQYVDVPIVLWACSGVYVQVYPLHAQRIPQCFWTSLK